MPMPLHTSDRIRNIAADAVLLPAVPFGPRHFEVNGQRIRLNRKLRRIAWRYERAVEIPLAVAAYRRLDPAEVLEVGNVLHLYGMRGHTVVDKYEVAPGVINEDIVGFRSERHYSLAITISTLEHVGWDEDPVEPDKAAAALEIVSELADAMFATIPVGYHARFEEVFVKGPFQNVILMVRRSRLGRWEQQPLEERKRIRYGQPYTAGNGVLIGTRTQDL
jgi:hypothetical protein